MPERVDVWPRRAHCHSMRNPIERAIIRHSPVTCTYVYVYVYTLHVHVHMYMYMYRVFACVQTLMFKHRALMTQDLCGLCARRCPAP